MKLNFVVAFLLILTGFTRQSEAATYRRSYGEGIDIDREHRIDFALAHAKMKAENHCRNEGRFAHFVERKGKIVHDDGMMLELYIVYFCK